MNVSRTKAFLRPLAFILAVVVAPRLLLGTAIPYRAQDFPLIDDWAFDRGAYAFFHNHELDYQHWASPALLGQWLWSVPFLAVLGDSRLATRVSTIVLSCLGLWAFYTLVRRQAGVPPSVAAFATACLAWNPFFFFLSWSFMTDVPAVSFSLIALALYVHALDSGRLVTLAAAVLVALAAIATRQNALAVPLTAGVLLLRSGYRTKPLWLAAVAVPLAFFVVLDAWHSKRPDVVVLHARLPNLDDLCWLVFTSVHYLGLLATPLLFLLPSARRGKVFWATLGIMIASALWLVFLGQGWKYEGIFPYVDDLFTARRSHLLREGESWGALFSWSFRLLATALGCICAAAILARLAESGRRLLTCPLVIFALLHLAILALAPTYFDRYLLPLVPGVLALAVWERRGPQWKAGLAALIVLGGLSIGLTHDWLSWNAACWEVGRRAAAHGIDPGDIQGGFEWDFYHPRNPCCHYRLSFAPSGASDTSDAEPFTLWFPPRKGAVYLIRLQHDERGAATPPESDEPIKKEQPPGAFSPSPSN